MIRVLPNNIANLIAAGEVVSRPASAAKELMENSIDAGADNIQLVILDSGRTLIQVIDNGCGMGPEDAVLCFERHATSKIADAEDLEKIMTYGFRGEALASIAAVGEVVLKTRRAQDELGIQVTASASKITNTTPASTPVGCNISVRNLFYNIPARRKFLKTDAAEMRHIIAEFSRVALVNPDISFSLTHNGKILYNLKSTSSKKQRIIDLCGKELNRELVDIGTDTSVVKIHGYIGKPEDARKRLGNQFLFINGRFFRSPYFNKAICKPYEGMIPDGYTPSYFIFLESDPSKIDVNIHPAKTEVKFEDEAVVFDILSACVRESLGKNSFVPSLDFDTGTQIDFPISGFRDSGYTAPPKVNYDPLFNPFEHESRHFDHPSKLDAVPDEYLSENNFYGKIFEDTTNGASQVIILKNRYLLTPSTEGLMVVDLKRARERIFFERYLPLLAERQQITQQSLFPLEIALSSTDHSCLLENLHIATAMGYDIRDLGDNTMIVYGVPDGMSADDAEVKQQIDDIIARIQQGGFEEDSYADAAMLLANSAARINKREITVTEANSILDQLFACHNCETAPSGKKCVTIISLNDLTKGL